MAGTNAEGAPLWQDPVVMGIILVLLLISMLPRRKSAPQYGSAAYWDNRYRETWDSAFEWYVKHADVERAGFLTRAVLSIEGISVLDVGCGNSNLAQEMYERSGRAARVKAIDFSESVIEAMRSSAPSAAHRDMYVWMDARAMDFKGGTFHVAVDKGTLDGLVGDGTCAAALHDARRVLAEVARVLKPSCTYITISVTDWAADQWPTKLGLTDRFRHFDGKRVAARTEKGETIAVFVHSWTKLTNREKERELKEAVRRERQLCAGSGGDDGSRGSGTGDDRKRKRT